MSNKNRNKNEELSNDNSYVIKSRKKSESDVPSSKSSKESSKTKIIELNILENLNIQKIKDLNSKCLEFIFVDKSEIALEILKKLEAFLETNILEAKFNFDNKLIILIIHNIACCYQKLKDYENCISYLDSVIYHFEKEIEKKYKIKINEESILQNIYKDISSNSLLGDMILELRFCAKFHLQMCAVLSQAKKHMKALNHAKLALLICEDNLIKTYFLFQQMQSKDVNLLENIDNQTKEKNMKENSEFSISENEEKLKLTRKIINDLYNKIKKFRKNFEINENEKPSQITINNKKINSFDSYLKYRKNEIHDYQKNLALLNNIRKLFSNGANKEDWLSNLNIGNIMYLSPLNDGDLDLESEPKYELLGDAIIEKVIFLSVSYFCIAMEMYQLAVDKNNQKINGEFYLRQACNLIDMYLPVSCPIIKHYINSYYKYYEKDLDIIPEGKIVDYKINLTRNEVDISKDILSFIRIQKINYKNNNQKTITKINLSNNINIINKKEINEINLSNITNNLSKKIKIVPGLKLNLENILNNKNNSSRENGPKNIKFISIKENINSNSNNSNTKRKSNNENIQANNNFEIYPNKDNLNIAEKSKIKNLPKFQLNFNKINNLNKSEEENKNLSNNTAKIKFKKINVKISTHGKTNRDSSSKKKSKIDKFNSKKGFELKRLTSKKNINIKDSLWTYRKEKNSRIKNTKINTSKYKYLDKHISKTSRQKKSPFGKDKGIIKGNLFDKFLINKNKPIKKKTNEKQKKSSNKYKNNFGYLTQREATNFKLKEKVHFNEVHLKIKNNSLNNKKQNLLKKISSFKDVLKIKKNLDIKPKNNITNTNTVKINKTKKTKIKKESNGKNKIKRKKINIIGKLYNNLLAIDYKEKKANNGKNSKTPIKWDKISEKPKQINNFVPLIKQQNPFKI